MRLRQRIVVLAAVLLLAAGVATAQFADPQGPGGDPPDETQCAENDPDCLDGNGSGGGGLEDPCECINNAYTPTEGWVEFGDADNQPYNNWCACEAACLGENPDFEVSPAFGEYGLNLPFSFTRTDGEDVEGICGWDTIAGIQGWHLNLPTADRIAKFNKPEVQGWQSTAGSMYFKINSSEFTVSWTTFPSALGLDDMVIEAIENHNFDVETSANFIRVVQDNNVPGGVGITDFVIRYNTGCSPALIDMQVGLEPPNDWDSLLCKDDGWPPAK